MPRHPVEGWTNPIKDIEMYEAQVASEERAGIFKSIQGKPGKYVSYVVYFPYCEIARQSAAPRPLGLYLKSVKNYKDAVFLANKAGPGSRVVRRVERIRKVRMGSGKNNFILGIRLGEMTDVYLCEAK